MKNKKSEILMYQTKDGLTRVEVQLAEDTVWLSQQHKVELFDRAVKIITLLKRE